MTYLQGITLILMLAVASCAPRRPIPLTPPPQPQEDSSSLLRSALEMHAQGEYEGAAEYFLKTADLSGGRDLRRRALAAAALSRLKAGDREGFLAAEGQLETELSHVESRLLPRELADVIALGRAMRGERPPANTSDGIARLFYELRLENEGGHYE
jgi:hypothetical protein